MSMAHKCDRCGTYFDKVCHEDLVYSGDFHLYNRESHNYEAYELCKDCTMSLLKFLTPPIETLNREGE